MAPELSAADLPDVPVLAEGDERGLLARLERIQLVGVVRQYAGEPARSGHPLLREHLLVANAEGNLEELLDRGPEAVKIGHRPLAKLLVIREVQAAPFTQPAGEGRNVGRIAAVLRRGPDRGSHRKSPFTTKPDCNLIALAAPAWWYQR